MSESNPALLEEMGVLRRIYAEAVSAIESAERDARESWERARDLMNDPERLEDFRYYAARSDAVRNVRRKLAAWAKRAYFGRVDFHDREDSEPTRVYIGQLPTGCTEAVKVAERAGVRLVDWRSPIAGLYYSRSNSYTVPPDHLASLGRPDIGESGGVREGTLLLVRHLDVDRDQLRGCTDYVNRARLTEAAVSDSVLLRALSRYGVDRFAGVVETIQAEQDQLIRHPLDRHLIIQGAAGTGKTVVLLHRVAYALYVSGCRPEEVLVLTPGRLLLDQVADVLPGLDVGRVPQMTLEDFCRGLLGIASEDVLPAAVPAAFCLSPRNDAGRASLRRWARLRSGFRQKRVLDAPYASVCLGIEFELEDFRERGRILLGKDEVRRLWHADASGDLPYAVRHRRFAERLTMVLLDRLQGSRRLNKEEIRALRQRCSDLVSSYLEHVPSPSRLFWQRLYPAYRGWTAVTAALYPLAGVPAELWVLDDVGALLYLHLKVYGFERAGRYRYIFVDEAQSLSPVWLCVLKALLVPDGSITLAGDAYQLAVSVFGALLGNDRWRWARAILGPRTDLASLRVSYRSPAAVTKLASEVLKLLGVQIDMQAVREEEDRVRVIAHLYEFLQFLADRPELRFAAIVCRSQEAVGNFKKMLAEVFTWGHFGQRLRVLSLGDVGGAEFDAVFVPDLLAYSSRRPEEIRAFYTAVTRASHYLFLGMNRLPPHG